MTEEAAIVVDEIVGTKRIEGGGGALIGLVSKDNILNSHSPSPFSLSLRLSP